MPFYYLWYMKICSICNIEKSLDDFVKRNNRKLGVQSYCKECHNKKVRKSYRKEYMKNYDLNKTYGISLEEYNLMLAKQNFSCSICKIDVSKVNTKHKKHLCVDHDHVSGKVRGLLCDSCNRGIGLLKDDPLILLSAASYLKRHKE